MAAGRMLVKVCPVELRETKERTRTKIRTRKVRARELEHSPAPRTVEPSGLWLERVCQPRPRV